MNTLTDGRLAELNLQLPALAAEARARSLEFEQARRLSPDFAGKLKRAGVMRLLLPAGDGGIGASLPQWLEAMTILAEADASTGWVAAHGSACAALIQACATPAFRQEFFADPLACAAWSMLPRVQVVEQAEGLRISGSWGPASYELTGRVHCEIDALNFRV